VEDVVPLEPFLKWAGGKRWLVDGLEELIPSSYDRYIEPFLGGGSIFFNLLPKRAILADVNGRLIETYQAIQSDWQSVLSILHRHQRLHSTEYYYQERSRVRRATAERAAQFIYLNRTCWNGLYRVNLAGEFNVPRGSKNSVLLETDNFEEISSALKRAKLISQDFETTLSVAGEGDFVYLDPPYTVNHNLNGFLKYNEKIFSWKDQVRLRDSVVKAVARGASIAVSNANHRSIRRLYAGIGRMVVVGRKSVIAASALRRGAINELLVITW